MKNIVKMAVGIIALCFLLLSVWRNSRIAQ